MNMQQLLILQHVNEIQIHFLILVLDKFDYDL